MEVKDEKVSEWLSEDRFFVYYPNIQWVYVFARSKHPVTREEIWPIQESHPCWPTNKEVIE